MFTGIIEDIGSILSIKKSSGKWEFFIKTALAKAKSKPIYLDIGAKTYSTEEFAKYIEHFRNTASDPDFLV